MISEQRYFFDLISLGGWPSRHLVGHKTNADDTYAKLEVGSHADYDHSHWHIGRFKGVHEHEVCEPLADTPIYSTPVDSKDGLEEAINPPQESESTGPPVSPPVDSGPKDGHKYCYFPPFAGSLGEDGPIDGDIRLEVDQEEFCLDYVYDRRDGKQVVYCPVGGVVYPEA